MPPFGLRSGWEHERADRVGEAEFVSRSEFERCLRPICRLSQQLAHLGEVRCASESRNRPAEERQRKTVTVGPVALPSKPPAKSRHEKKEDIRAYQKKRVVRVIGIPGRQQTDDRKRQKKRMSPVGFRALTGRQF